MTLNVQYSWQDYTTDGVQTIFPYPFYVKEKLDLSAYWEQSGTPPWHPGQPITAPLPSAFYTLTGLGQPGGGTLVTQTPLPPGRLVLRRGTPQNQLTDYLEGDAFPAESHETALDRLTVLVQDHEEVLSRAALLRVETGTPHRGLSLPDPQPNTLLGWDSTAAQWTLYPSGITSIPVDPVSGIGWGKHTVALTPAAGAAQASALVFPAGVLGMALTLWVETTLGQSQGLLQVGIGTPAQPDCWGYLAALTAATETTAGLFEGYSGQPHLGGGVVILTAYGGRFDGVGTVYLTGHFATFRPSQTVGYSYHPGGPDDSAPLPFGYATENQPGLVELGTPAEVLDGTNPLVVVTPATLQAKWATIPGITPASESTAGITRYGTTPETVPGLLTTVATHPAGVKAAIDAQTGPLQTTVTTHTSQISALQSTDTTHSSQISALQSTDTTHSSQISALQSTDTTHSSQISALQTKVPNGTALSVVRYTAAGTALEASPMTVTASGLVGLGTATPGNALHLVGETIQATTVQQDLYLTSASGPSQTARHARGTLAAPARVVANDVLLSLQGQGWARDLADTTDTWFLGGRLQLVADSTDAQGRIGGGLRLSLAPGAGQPVTEALRVTQASNLLLGTTTHGTSLTNGLVLGSGTAPTTSPADAVQVWAADRNAVAGKGSVFLRTEDGTQHVLGDFSGIGTTLTATLGSGASYQTLSVKGGTLFVNQSSVQERPQALIAPSFVVSTDATRTSRLTLSVYDASAAREGVRLETSGTAAMLGFYGSAAVAKPTVTGAKGGNAALTSLLSALSSLGLVTDSTT